LGLFFCLVGFLGLGWRRFWRDLVLVVGVGFFLSCSDWFFWVFEIGCFFVVFFVVFFGLVGVRFFGWVWLVWLFFFWVVFLFWVGG